MDENALQTKVRTRTDACTAQEVFIPHRAFFGFQPYIRMGFFVDGCVCLCRNWLFLRNPHRPVLSCLPATQWRGGGWLFFTRNEKWPLEQPLNQSGAIVDPSFLYIRYFQYPICTFLMYYWEPNWVEYILDTSFFFFFLYIYAKTEAGSHFFHVHRWREWFIAFLNLKNFEKESKGRKSGHFGMVKSPPSFTLLGYETIFINKRRRIFPNIFLFVFLRPAIAISAFVPWE